MEDADLEALREDLQPRWHDVRQRAVLDRALSARRAARAGTRSRALPVRRVMFVGVAIAAAIALAVVLRARSGEDVVATPTPAFPEPSASLPAAPARSEMHIADGSVALLAAGAALEVVAQTADHVHLRQSSGTVRYRVVRNAERLFEVEASEVRVTVLGTEFDVELHPGRVRVSVIEGRVRLDDATREIELGAGETLDVSAPRAEAEVIAAPSASAEPPAPRASIAELEARADEARRHGRHDEAAALLEQIVARDPRGARGEAALFTLGTIRGAQGRHALAARHFARYRERFPRGALFEDALAAEAVHAAELDAARAARLAAEYEERYPHGTHRREIEMLREP